MQGNVTLCIVILGQTGLMLVWIAVKEPTEWPRILRARPVALIVGAAGSTAALGRFTAMTLQNAAVVKALAQVEMLFTVATSVFIFREKIRPHELAGCAPIVAGLVVLTFWR